MDSTEIYTPKQVREHLKDLTGKSFVVEGIPTGAYSDRASYGNRPTLVVILDSVLPCQGYSRQYADRYFRPEVNESVKVALEKFRKSLGVHLEPETDWKNFPEWNNENLAVASACIDDCVRSQKKLLCWGR